MSRPKLTPPVVRGLALLAAHVGDRGPVAVLGYDPRKPANPGQRINPEAVQSWADIERALEYARQIHAWRQEQGHSDFNDHAAYRPKEQSK